MAKRFLSIWFPRLASDMAVRRRPCDGPFAVLHRAGNRDHVHCLNAVAAQRGVCRGMGAADARAICPDLITRPADLTREAAGLIALQRWCARYAPLVARDGSDGIVADITGVPHLFGGEADLRADLQARLTRVGLHLVSAIAETRGAAQALARHGGGLIPEGALSRHLGPLPVSALRVGHDVAEGLSRMGIDTIGDLLAVPRAPVAKRFGAHLLLRLDQAMGDQPEPVAADPAPPHFGVRMTLPDPIGLHGDVMAGVTRVLTRLCEKLEHHQRGARRIRLEVQRVDQATAQVDIGLARPMRDASRIAALFDKGVSELDAGFGIEALRVVAYVTEAMPPEQLGPRDTVNTDAALADLFSRLGNRLGFDRVQRMLPADSKIPERSFTIAPAAYSTAEPHPDPKGPARPILIFPPEPVTTHGAVAQGHPPVRFSWRRMSFTTLRADGPERIAPEWWFDDPNWRTGMRDYWRVETREGLRLWLFFLPQSPATAAYRWFAQGEFA